MKMCPRVVKFKNLNKVLNKLYLSRQGTVVLGVSVRFINRTLAWMRKVVGSNPGEADIGFVFF